MERRRETVREGETEREGKGGRKREKEREGWRTKRERRT